MSVNKKERLDKVVHSRWPQYGRKMVQSLIMQGKVLVNGHSLCKPGMPVFFNDHIVVSIDTPQFVSRAGGKLEKALDHFEIDLEGLVALDAGISTGGFTDCLLQRGIAKVYGVDVGYGQVHEKIRSDKRVILLERTNIRMLRDVGEKIDIITLDLSFISVVKVIDAVVSLLKKSGSVIVLIKPQFESHPKDIGRGGIVRDESVQQRAVSTIKSAFEARNFSFYGVIPSPVKGTKGNQEFLAYFKCGT